MENISNRFWLYLLGKKNKVMTKEEIKSSYNTFQKMWKMKEKNFAKVFDNLRKSRIKYIFNKKWYIFNKKEFDDLKNKRFSEHEIVFRFLKEQKIPYYIGLTSAKYFNKLSWQSLKVLYVINSEFKLKRKIGNVEIKLIKFPKSLIVKMATVKSNNKISYSDVEKTFLDEIYYSLYKKGSLQLTDYDFSELDTEKIKAYLAFYSKYNLVKKEVVKRLNKKQKEILKW
jgi:hypothetical protein